MKIPLSFFIFLLSSKICWGCGPGEIIPEINKEVVSVSCGLDFQYPLNEIKKIFEEKNPEVLIYIQPKASRELGYVLQERKFKPRVDIVITSSPEVIESFFYPDLMDWYIVLGRDELCVVYREDSKYAEKINENNWRKILVQKDTALGRVDENLDPLGFRTLLAWKLMDIYYKDTLFQALLKNTPLHNIYPNIEALSSSLKAGDNDYAFNYLSAAKREGFSHIRLPPQINLGEDEFSSLYKQVAVTISGTQIGEILEVRGKPIYYGVGFFKESVSKGWPKKFFKFIFSHEGEAIFRKYNIRFTPLYYKGSIPQEFKESCFSEDSL